MSNTSTQDWNERAADRLEQCKGDLLLTSKRFSKYFTFNAESGASSPEYTAILTQQGLLFKAV